jgi:transcriptional regulator with XRE-family HTH domain
MTQVGGFAVLEARVVHGATVRALREKAGTSQERLAAKAGLATQTISRIETGRVKLAHPLTIKAIAEALDVDPSIITRR